jgi:hypothetical protein
MDSLPPLHQSTQTKSLQDRKTLDGPTLSIHQAWRRACAVIIGLDRNGMEEDVIVVDAEAMP